MLSAPDKLVPHKMKLVRSFHNKESNQAFLENMHRTEFTKFSKQSKSLVSDPVPVPNRSFDSLPSFPGFEKDHCLKTSLLCQHKNSVVYHKQDPTVKYKKCTVVYNLPKSSIKFLFLPAGILRKKINALFVPPNFQLSCTCFVKKLILIRHLRGDLPRLDFYSTLYLAERGGGSLLPVTTSTYCKYRCLILTMYINNNMQNFEQKFFMSNILKSPANYKPRKLEISSNIFPRNDKNQKTNFPTTINQFRKYYTVFKIRPGINWILSACSTCEQKEIKFLGTITQPARLKNIFNSQKCTQLIFSNSTRRKLIFCLELNKLFDINLLIAQSWYCHFGFHSHTNCNHTISLKSIYINCVQGLKNETADSLKLIEENSSRNSAIFLIKNQFSPLILEIVKSLKNAKIISSRNRVIFLIKNQFSPVILEIVRSLKNAKIIYRKI